MPPDTMVVVATGEQEREGAPEGLGRGAAACDRLVTAAIQEALANIAGQGVAGADVRERGHLDPGVKAVLRETHHLETASMPRGHEHFTGLGSIDVVLDDPPILMELKWSYDEQRSKIFESVWDAVKLSLLAGDTGKHGYIATGASHTAWASCESADLFETGVIDPQEIWGRPLDPAGPNYGRTVGEDVILGSKSRGRPLKSPGQLEMTAVVRLPYRDDYELRVARVAGAGPLTDWPTNLPGTEVPPAT